jgi:hypothetical protein
MDPPITKTIFRFGLSSQVAMLLLLFVLLSGVRRACGRCVGAPEGSAPEAILSEAGLSLAEARRTHFRSKGPLLADIFER